MEAKEIKDLLAEMKTGLEGKTAEQIKNEMGAFEEKYNAFVAENGKEIEGIEAKMAEMQKHVDNLDVKLQERKKGEMKTGDALKDAITENFGEIKTVRKGHAIQVKAVGDMTLGNNLTGDQPRSYSATVAAIPGQLINVADLVGAISIDGGTYTFPREGAGEGAIAAQTEGNAKSQRDYDFTMVDVNTDFIAGFTVYSKKMANNLPFLESHLPGALRRDYWKAENAAFHTVIAAGATASAVVTGNKVERLISNIAALEGADEMPNGIVVTPADFWDIMVTEKSTGAGYGLPGVVSFSNGQLAINGIPVYKATWLAADKYIVGDFSALKKVTTQGLGVEFFEQDSDNVRKNNITARVEAQVALAIERPAAIIYGDFTAV